MKTVHISNIVYDIKDNKIDSFTLPKDMVFIVSESFNKYVEVAQLIKQHTTFLPKSYFIREDNDVQKYINYENVEEYMKKENSEHVVHV